MSLDTGGPWLQGQPYSLSKMNRKTLTFVDGDDVASISPQPLQVIGITGDGGGFKENDMIYRNADNDTWLHLTMRKHTHFGTSNQDGGSIIDVYLENITTAFYDQNNFPSSAHFQIQETANSGSITFDSTYGAVSVNSNTSTNGTANIKRVGSAFGYERNATLLENCRYVGALSSFFVRSGIQMESMLISNDVLKCFGKEACPATNNNWFIVSSEGIQRTQVDSEFGIENDQQRQIVIRNLVGNAIELEYHESGATQKGSNLPVTGKPPGNNIYSAGVKSTNTSGKKYVIHGMAMAGYRDDDIWI